MFIILAMLAHNDTDWHRIVASVRRRRQYSHMDLVEMIDGVDFERGTVVAGNRVSRIHGCLAVRGRG
jgi:seryl-tRNA synthetase